MLQQAKASAAMPASDLARARAFYEGTLGFKPDPEVADDQGVMYRCGDGTAFLVFLSSGASSGTHTQLTFEVDDVDAELREVRDKGVALEDYDLPSIKTEGGIAHLPDGTGGFFKDTEGNLIAIFQRAQVPSPATS
jgi:catechol 2,3-dioxygenase-like lactoylglutathione lyase family enzyme